MSKLLKLLRRVPEKMRPPRCKRGSNCPVDATVQLHCPGCRFAKCLRKESFENIFIVICFLSRVGMQLSQVLTPSQRKERFVSLQRRRQRQVRRDRNLRPSPPSRLSRHRHRHYKMRARGRRMLKQSVKLSTKTTLWRAIPPQWRSPPPQSQRLHPVQESLSCSCHFLR